MAQRYTDKKTSRSLGREGKITALTLLKNFYEEEIFRLLVKEFYDSDMEVSEAAIRSSGSLGNEIAIPHLYQIIERGRSSQRIAAIQTLMSIRAPSSTTMLIKYFNHFPEDDVRAEILTAINAISPTAEKVQELNQAVFIDPKQSESVKRIAVEALVEAEKYTLLKDALPRSSPQVQEAAFAKMLQSGAPEVLDFVGESLAPSALGCYLCVYTLKAKNPQQNFIMESLQAGHKQVLMSFLQSLSGFQGRLHYPTRVFRLLLITPFVDAETEALVGDFVKKIIAEVKNASPHLLSEFSMMTSTHLDTVFGKLRKNYISLQGITNKEVLLATVFASLLEKHGTPKVVEDVQRYFKAEYSGLTPPIAQLRSLLAKAPKEDQNRFEACIALFSLPEKKDKLQVFSLVSKVDLNRRIYLRRLNRLIRVAGVLEIKTASKKIQEILDFARGERIQFLEETSIVTLCQLLTRSIIEQSKEYFGQPDKNLRTLNGYIRGARFIPAKIMIGPLVHLLHLPSLVKSSRALIVDSLLSMDLTSVRRILPALLKVLDMPEIEEELKLQIGEILCLYADSSIGHQLADITGHPDPAARRVAVRALKTLARKGQGIASEVLTNRLYLLLDDKKSSVKMEALLALLELNDDYAVQIIGDYVKAGDGENISKILSNIGKTLSRDIFSLVMDTLGMESAEVQQALRKLLPDLCQGSFSEELRQVLVESLTESPQDGRKLSLDAIAQATPQPNQESMLGQAKLEFKFKRENTQILTVFFIDIAGYTEKSTTIDMSSLLKLIKAFEDMVESSIAGNRGSVVKKWGDGILAVFKHPLNATIAALDVQRKITQYNSMRVEKEKFHARIGLNTGTVIRKDNDIFGEVVNVAARMQTAASPGDILLTESTFQEVREYVRCTELGKIQVKGIKDAITAYSPEEVVVDMQKIHSGSGEAASAGSGESGETSLEKLKESIFTPDFKLPAECAENADTAAFLKEIFSDISRAVEDIAGDYHEEYAFKRYLQEKWNQLVKRVLQTGR
jgi:class 3 adenylate cyclase/HEAT repeat protein